MKLSSNRLVTTAVALICILGISGCVSDPSSVNAGLSPDDALYKSVNCVAARQAGDKYDDNGVERMVAGGLLGLLGPIGLPVAAAIDMRQLQVTQRVNGEIQSSCVTMEPRTLVVPPKNSPTVPLNVDSQPSGAIAIITKEPLSALVKNMAEADGIAALGVDNPYWKNKIIIAHCLTPCIVNVPRGAIFYANALKRGYSSTGYGKGLTWVDSGMYGRTLNSDNITFRLVPVASELSPR